MKPLDLIISSIFCLKKEKLNRVLKKNKGARGWNIFNFNKRNQTNCMHKIKFDFKPFGYTGKILREAPEYIIKWSS